MITTATPAARDDECNPDGIIYVVLDGYVHECLAKAGFPEAFRVSVESRDAGGRSIALDENFVAIEYASARRVLGANGYVLVDEGTVDGGKTVVSATFMQQAAITKQMLFYYEHLQIFPPEPGEVVEPFKLWIPI